MLRLFVDTSAFYALADRSDRHHLTARVAWERHADSDELVTSDYVVVETWLLICARLGRPSAMRFWDAMAGGVVTVVGVTGEDLAQARALAGRWTDQTFSLVDCTSFALLERLGIDRALAFDRHFQVIRLGSSRNRALNLVASAGG